MEWGALCDNKLATACTVLKISGDMHSFIIREVMNSDLGMRLARYFLWFFSVP